jgi:serine/threonine-protein kinase
VRREGSFERLFAVKRLRPELSSEPEVRAMFLDEARIAGLIRHPNVVSIVDVGEDHMGPFAVMELVDGIPVADLLGKSDVHPLPLEVVLRITRDAAEGLHAAHELTGPDGTPLELVHRDVSPPNILLGFDGVARVTDFGVAKALGRLSKTSTGVLKGKLGYLSPEQLRFEEPDRRADLFALGVVLFELCTGQRLYSSRVGSDGPRRILTEPPPDLADFRDDVEPELVELLFELLAKSRDARPESAKAVARRLDAMLARHVASGDAIETADCLARHFSPERSELRARIAEARGRPAAKTASSRRSFKWAGAAVGLIALVAAGWFLVRAASAPKAEPEHPVLEPSPPAALAGESSAIAPIPASAEPPPAPSPAPSAAPSSVTPSRARQKSPASAGKPKSGIPIWERY